MPYRCRALLFRRSLEAAVLALGAGCGGETVLPSGAGNQPTYEPCEESANIETVMITDFESAPTFNAFSSNDGSTGAVILGPEASPLEAPRCGDGDAGSGYHVTAVGLQGYGLSFGFNGLGVLPGAGSATYFDAGAWDGISMWVRKGHAEASSSLFAAVSERYTDPAGALLFTAEEQEGLLPAAQCPADQAMGQRCYCAFDAVDVDGDTMADPLASQCDRFGAGIGIDVEWRFFKVPFDRMRQRAYGRAAPSPAPDRRILGFDFGLQGVDIDFWMDDLAFYRDPPPEPAAE